MMRFANDDNIIEYLYSEIGKHHIDVGVDNQDSIFIGKVCDKTYCMVVADGVSSCKWSKAGSEATIDTIKNLAKKLYLGEMSIDYLDEIKRFIVRDWKSHFDEDWNEYGTTLNFVIWWNGNVLVGQIGDGLIVGDADGKFFLMTDMDECYSVETFALAEVVLKSSIQLLVRKNVKKLVTVAMTDGIGKEMNIELLNEFLNYFIELILNSEEEIRNSEIESWMNQLRQKNDDDKTIGLFMLGGEA